jgi:tetratricopeptide (TPR) repeat protein
VTTVRAVGYATVPLPMTDKKKLPMLGGQKADLSRLLDGDSAAVIETLQAAVAEAPEDEVAWLKLGVAYLHIAHFTEAAEALASAVALDDSVIDARRLYAQALSRLRRHDEAAFQLVQAKRMAPDDARVRKELGIAFYDKRLFDKAIRELDKARELAPSDARVSYALGLAHEGNRDVPVAITFYRRAVELEPGLVEVRRTLADALAAMGEMSGAVSELEQALRLDRSNTQIAMNLEVLRNGLRELELRRLLGHGEAEAEQSALVREGQLKRKGSIRGDVGGGGHSILRYGAELAEMWLTLDEHGNARRIMLLLRDPDKAAAAPDDAFGVTIVSEDGELGPTNYATAVTLTFLREALGCPMTTASSIYAKLLTEREAFSWGGVQVGFDKAELGEETLHGLYVEL